jgi:hypothetical protein
VGKQRVISRGKVGVEERVYRVRTVDGDVVGRTLVRRVVVVSPRPRVIAVGTRRQASCDPNYSGCVPISRDVDCAGGQGDGPAYLDTAVRITGSDIYDLDRDGDGWACEDD